VLADVIAPGLDVVFCGINPGLYSAAVGCHFGRPGNRFWPVLDGAGFTDRRLDPSEQRALLDYGCGITNVVARTTAKASELGTAELRRGARDLRCRIERYQPRVLAVLGIGAYRSGFGVKDASVGPQQAAIGTTHVWVLPNPSGLNAHYRLDDLVRLYAELRAALN
jgi:TDG/mug DNA glycosylase family protein